MSENASYTRLPGRSHRFFGIAFLFDIIFMLGQSALATRCRLYEGPDHLLLVELQFFTENVRRFRFRDIQAITLRRTRHYSLMALFLAVILLTLGITAIPRLLADPQPVAIAVTVGAAALLLLLLLIHLALGPTCQTELHTAVHRQPLPNLARWRTANKVLRHLEPRIRAAQTVPAEIPAPSSEDADVPAQPQPALIAGAYNTGPSLSSKGRIQATANTQLVGLYLWFLLLLAMSCGFDIFFNNVAKNIFDTLLYAGTLMLGAVALGGLRHAEALRPLRNIAAAGVIAIIVLFYIGQFMVSAQVFTQMDDGGFNPILDVEEPTSTMRWYAAISGVTYAAIAISGFFYHRLTHKH